MARTHLERALYYVRDLRSQPLFKAIEKYTSGEVLDVGGWDFFRSVRDREIAFDRWTILEVERQDSDDYDDERVSLVVGDGCAMEFEDESFDSILNVQVLEHVFEPIKMVEEMTRVLRPGGHMIILYPTTATLHMAPHHFYNFTRYWGPAVAKHCNLEVVEFVALGGRWSSTASHMLSFLMQVVGVKGTTAPDVVRSKLFNPLLLASIPAALGLLPLSLVLSVADLEEEANNHLIVLRKPAE